MKRTAFSPHDNIYIQYLKKADKHNMQVQHYHDMYEMYLQLAGKRYLFYDNICYTLERGDLAVFMPFDIHYAESRESDYYERYVLNFQEDNFSKILNSEEKYLLMGKIKPCVVHLSEEQTQIMYDYFRRAEAFSKKKGFLAEKVLYSAVLQLVLYAIECIDDRTIVEGETISPQIMSAIKYINKHYMERLSLDNIAEASRLSKFHFSHKFKEVTGATVLEYLNNVRLTKVHSLLIDTKTSIEEIAKNTGFSSSLQLTRVFKDTYGMSPRDFRKEQKRIE